MSYEGVVIEESLRDKRVLRALNIVSTRTETVTEEHRTPWLKKWTLHTVVVEADAAEPTASQLSEALQPNYWYADFKDEQTHYVIFSQRIFTVDRREPAQYQAVVEYGLGLGIPDYQLDFSPAIEQWERPAGG